MLLPSRLPRYPRLTWLAPFTLLAGCTGVPEGTQPVNGFQIDHYLGQWYEIARLDHGFEEGLACVTANYSRREDGDIRVINRGYDPAEQRWESAEGQASFVGDSDVGHLKVSFFGPSMRATTSWRWMKVINMRWFPARTETTCGYFHGNPSWTRQPMRP